MDRSVTQVDGMETRAMSYRLNVSAPRTDQAPSKWA